MESDYLGTSVKPAKAKSLAALTADQRQVLPSLATLPSKVLLLRKEAAAVLSISERTLWKLSKSKKLAPSERIPFIRLGRSVRYSIDDIREWVAKQQRS